MLTVTLWSNISHHFFPENVALSRNLCCSFSTCDASVSHTVCSIEVILSESFALSSLYMQDYWEDGGRCMCWAVAHTGGWNKGDKYSRTPLQLNYLCNEGLIMSWRNTYLMGIVNASTAKTTTKEMVMKALLTKEEFWGQGRRQLNSVICRFTWHCYRITP